jgi:predicted SnoaL-like aldol condensation-catalyzing enzyme
MRKITITLLVLAASIFNGFAQGKEIKPKNNNERCVIGFYDAGLNRKDFTAAARYIGATYIQHNPKAADGPQGFRQFLEFLKINFPKSHWQFTQIFSDGNYVILHVHERLAPDDAGSAVIDIFRLDSGKIVEHWDVVQSIPAQAANKNTMF